MLYLRDFIFQNLKQKRSRTIMCILGIVLSTMTVMVITMTSERYQQTASGFFTPFNAYSQIIEKGANYFQFLPAGSFLEAEYQAEIEDFFQEETIPALIVSYDESVSSFEYNYILGTNLSDISTLWEKTGLSVGKWPNSIHEVVVGSSVEFSDDQIYIQNKTFHVSGILSSSSSFMDGIIVCDLLTLQTSYNYTDRVSLFFISNQVQNDEVVQEFETQFPQLNFLTTEEQDEIKGSMGNFYTDIIELFTFFAIITALVFVFAIETMNVLSRKKDIAVLLLMGTPKMMLMKLLWIEIALITIIGLIIGVPLSLIAYISIFAFIQVQIGSRDNFATAFRIFGSNTLKVAPFKLMFQSIGLIFFGGILIAIIPALIVFRVNILSEIKKRN
ncbi:ABC transporter permease [Candidatus Lokiarchaeum ossiferum]|uniref:ABC transporter permease n=1 Tax=Candidatus Lokiarchaeum ossiferum TaxID=2951803 RepID=UPI00352C2950